MCGRYAAFLPPEAIAALFQTRGALPNWPPTWNMAPTRDGPVVRLHPQTGERRLDLLRWGLLPHWAKDPASTRQPINARAETLGTSAMFRDAFARRRCLVPADAFYEWTLSDTAEPSSAAPPDEAEGLGAIGRLAAPAPPDMLAALSAPPEMPSAAASATPDMPAVTGGAPDTAGSPDRTGGKRPSPRGAKARTPPRPGKQPWAIAREDGQPIAFAGLWEGWRGPDGNVVRSYTIVTTGANDTLRPLHERMPVVLEPTDWPLWLGEADGDAGSLLRPSAAGFRFWPVGSAVNNVRNDDATLLQEVRGSLPAARRTPG